MSHVNFLPDDELPASLLALRESRVLAPTQAQAICELWDESPGDLWSDPRVRGVLSHTRAVVDRLRGQLCPAVPFEEQEDGELHG